VSTHIIPLHCCINCGGTSRRNHAANRHGLSRRPAAPLLKLAE
jgi:hypothetical protein